MTIGSSRDGGFSRGGCPVCAKTIPFSRAVLRRGRAFACADCSSSLIVRKAPTLVAIALFVALSFWAKRVPFAIIAVIFIFGLLFEWLLARVELANEEAPTP